MVSFRFAGIAVLLAAVALAVGADVPRALVAATADKGKKPETPTSLNSLVNRLAQELDEDGRTIPIVWGYTDPIFRRAVDEGKLNAVVDYPNAGEAVSAGRSLGAEYVLLCSAKKAHGGLKAQLDVLLNGRQIWKNEQTLLVRDKDGLFDPDGTAASIARTWVMLAASGPFKGLPKKAVTATPDPLPGQVPKIETPVSPPLAPATAQQYRKTLADLVAKGDLSRAIAYGRDLVDSDPFDPERRVALAELLGKAGQLESAAMEAHRAASLMPDSTGLWTMSVHLWLSAGKFDDAKQDLNEAISHSSGSPASMLLAAQVSLARLEPEKAVGFLDKSVRADPSAQEHFTRALARALLGGVEGVGLDATAMAKLEAKPADESSNWLYSFAVDVLGRATLLTGNTAKDLLQRAGVRRDDATLRESLDNLLRQCQARVAFLDRIPSNDAARKSWDRWSLAQKLLIQALTDLDGYVRDGKEDTLTDCRIDLAEAIKQATAARADTAGAEGARNAAPEPL